MAKNKVRKDKRSFLYVFGYFLTWWIVYFIFGLKVIKGKNNIPKEGGYIAAGNHLHLPDPIILSYSQRRQMRFMAKAELFRNPIMACLCRWYGAFPVNRGTADGNSIEASLKILEEGKVLGIFPEGTRVRNGEIGRGKTGVAMLAHKSQKPIYPFAVYTKRSPKKLFCKYRIAFGDPVTAQELGITEGTAKEYREATRKLMDIIRVLYEECRKDVEG